MDWTIVLDVGVGVGVLFVGIGVLWACGALAKTLGRVNVTLAEVDNQLSAVGKPVSETLRHVGGMLTRPIRALLTTSCGYLEDVAGKSRDGRARKDTLSAIVNVGATIRGKRRFTRFVTEKDK